MMRPDERAPHALRPVTLEVAVNPQAEGSCFVQFGDTHVLCTASVTPGVPRWRRDSGLGWLTAEYAMLPRATSERSPRERRGPGGRTSEIQRLIGRSLRAAMRDFDFGEHTIYVDCDVLRADGGTRTAAITGAAVALAQACSWMERELGVDDPFGRLVAGVSVGIVDGEHRVDLCYEEDRDASVDANIVVAHPDRFVEVQSSAEGEAFARDDLDRLVDLALQATTVLFEVQSEALAR